MQPPFGLQYANSSDVVIVEWQQPGRPSNRKPSAGGAMMARWRVEYFVLRTSALSIPLNEATDWRFIECPRNHRFD
jgi:hypothetical protein